MSLCRDVALLGVALVGVASLGCRAIECPLLGCRAIRRRFSGCRSSGMPPADGRRRPGRPKETLRQAVKREIVRMRLLRFPVYNGSPVEVTSHFAPLTLVTRPRHLGTTGNEESSSSGDNE